MGSTDVTSKIIQAQQFLNKKAGPQHGIEGASMILSISKLKDGCNNFHQLQCPKKAGPS